MSVPKLDMSQTSLDKFAQDLEKLKLDAPYKVVTDADLAVPSFQRQGYLEKLGHSRKKWFKRFFVLRDSFLLSYNLDKSELTVEPRSCVHLANCKIQEFEHGNKPCISLTSMDKDQFMFGCATDEERKAWLKDIQIARTITHTNMVKLSVENQYIAEKKYVDRVTQQKSTSALAIFSNNQYIRKTPIVGGAEGWLFTPGFNAAFNTGQGSKVKWTKHYFILRDSHLLMFRGGDVLTKPRGCMYLVGTQTEPLEQSEDKSLFVFVCRSDECGDMIELACSSEKARLRWISALRIGARVTYRDFKLLLKEHELLLAYTSDDKKTEILGQVPSFAQDEVDIQGRQLDPGVVQAYSQEGAPILRDPDGKLVDAMTGEIVEPIQPRFDEGGQQLDPFNRPLPEGALPMFTSDKTPIGVGPDGKHYLPDGTVVPHTDPHYDANGNRLPQEVIDKALGIASQLDVAIKVRAHLKGEGESDEAVDALGRTFRQLNEENGMIINADGDKVPIHTARVLDRDDKTLVDYKTYREKKSQTHRDQGTTPIEEQAGVVTISMESEDDHAKEVCTLEVEQGATLKDLRLMIVAELPNTDFVFLVDSLPLMKFEESNRLALSLGTEILIRPRKGISVSNQAKPFAKKIQSIHVYEQQKLQERSEFEDVMKRIQTGNFLKPLNRDELPPAQE
eukprot:c38929_g1_i1.p1 GENE.c38929_g1_i1~~c38929_g1_i1.p1  ORF type:complete len:695 (+),score=134.23 c38929_g1_i1:60-2087(+)